MTCVGACVVKGGYTNVTGVVLEDCDSAIRDFNHNNPPIGIAKTFRRTLLWERGLEYVSTSIIPLNRFSRARPLLVVSLEVLDALFECVEVSNHLSKAPPRIIHAFTDLGEGVPIQ